MTRGYCKLRQLTLLEIATRGYYKLRQVRYYKLPQVLLQIATGITNCDVITNCNRHYKLRRYYKLQQVLQIATGITNCDVITNCNKYYELRRYYKLQQVLQIAKTVITNCDSTHSILTASGLSECPKPTRQSVSANERAIIVQGCLIFASMKNRPSAKL